ncbi:hypothetical protein HMPREF9713_00536 [Myroides odoratimimus CCUG 12700]|nr:hypothetical protein HMPREF9713_00536 [Myroides odoratimimus CCUG 12700]
MINGFIFLHSTKSDTMFIVKLSMRIYVDVYY